MASHDILDVFLSHSSRDVELARALVELLRGALNLPAARIRCTSVSGHKLNLGANTDEQLRREIVEARVLVGLITDVSVESAYVQFELGARWGANKFLAPLLGAGCGPEALAGPLARLNALSCTREDLFQFVANVGAELGIQPERPNVYSAVVDKITTVSNELASQRRPDASEAEKQSATESQPEQNLTDFQYEYLMTISRPRNEGFIYGGLDNQKGREVAQYQEAMAVLIALDLASHSEGGYKLTPTGWKLADQLWQLKVLDVLPNDAFKSDEEIAKEVELTDGESENKELRRHLSELESRELISLTRTRGRWNARVTEAGLTQRKHRHISV